MSGDDAFLIGFVIICGVCLLAIYLMMKEGRDE